MSDFDKFPDVIDRQEGIFGGLGGIDDAMGDYNQPKAYDTAAGVVSEQRCRNCGNTRRITFGWPEIIAMRLECSPQLVIGGDTQWARNHEGMFPANLLCTGCPGLGTSVADQSLLRPIFTPQECLQRLQRALQNGWISPQQEQQITAVVSQRLQQYPDRGFTQR